MHTKQSEESRGKCTYSMRDIPNRNLIMEFDLFGEMGRQDKAAMLQFESVFLYQHASVVCIGE